MPESYQTRERPAGGWQLHALVGRRPTTRQVLVPGIPHPLPSEKRSAQVSSQSRAARRAVVAYREARAPEVWSEVVSPPDGAVALGALEQPTEGKIDQKEEKDGQRDRNVHAEDEKGRDAERQADNEPDRTERVVPPPEHS